LISFGGLELHAVRNVDVVKAIYASRTQTLAAILSAEIGANNADVERLFAFVAWVSVALVYRQRHEAESAVDRAYAFAPACMRMCRKAGGSVRIGIGGGRNRSHASCENWHQNFSQLSPMASAPPFDQAYGLSIRPLLIHSDDPLIVNSIFVRSYPALLAGLAGTLRDDPSGRSLNCVQQAFCVWMATSDARSAYACFRQASDLMLEVAPLLEPHLERVLHRVCGTPPSHADTNGRALVAPGFQSAAALAALPPRPSQPAPNFRGTVFVPLQTKVTEANTSVEQALPGHRFNPSTSPRSTATQKRPFVDAELTTSSSGSMTSDDETELCDSSQSSKRSSRKSMSTRHNWCFAFNMGSHRLRDIRCAYRGCDAGLSVSQAHLCVALYERTHWKSYMCSAHNLTFADTSTTRCYSCATDEEKLYLTKVGWPGVPFACEFWFCQPCLARKHVLAQLKSVRLSTPPAQPLVPEAK
jgi:hypothetical protein